MIYNFHAAMQTVRRWEGGLVDHPDDPGGLTNKGISLRCLRAIKLDINGDGKVDGADIRAMTDEAAAPIFRGHFWDKVAGDELPAGLDLAVFDSAVNQGPARAARFLQAALHVTVDGQIGPLTLDAARRRVRRNVLVEFMVRRSLHYTGLVHFAVFGLGWLRRAYDVFYGAVLLALREDC